jgi:hypothetical protein
MHSDLFGKVIAGLDVDRIEKDGRAAVCELARNLLGDPDIGAAVADEDQPSVMRIVAVSDHQPFAFATNAADVSSHRCIIAEATCVSQRRTERMTRYTAVASLGGDRNDYAKEEAQE